MNAEQIRFLNRLKKTPKRTLRKFLKTTTRKKIAEQTGISYHLLANRIKKILMLAVIILGISSVLYSFNFVNWNSTGKTQVLCRGNRTKTSSLMVASHNTLLPISPTYYIRKQIMAVITSYQAVRSQTDNKPCIAASGMNICETEKKIAANNCLEFGTKIELPNGEIYEIQDRMNSRFDCQHFDLLTDKKIKTKKQITIY